MLVGMISLLIWCSEIRVLNQYFSFFLIPQKLAYQEVSCSYDSNNNALYYNRTFIYSGIISSRFFYISSVCGSEYVGFSPFYAKKKYYVARALFAPLWNINHHLVVKHHEYTSKTRLNKVNFGLWSLLYL